MTMRFIREVHYSEWLSNMVMVKKESGKWIMCVYFTDLNKACPKDSFPIPKIDQLVDTTAGHELLSFMDFFSGYNQILMFPLNQEKMSFITHQRNYCYQVMSFGLKNAEATYQRLVNKLFKNLIDKNIELYMDDMIVKSVKAVDHVANLRESFLVLKENEMKLNLEKSIFELKSGKYLGFIVSQRKIEANPDKVQAILEMKSLSTVKEIQWLNNKIAVLNRFISKAIDKCFIFFQAIKKKEKDR